MRRAWHESMREEFQQVVESAIGSARPGLPVADQPRRRHPHRGLHPGTRAPDRLTGCVPALGGYTQPRYRGAGPRRRHTRQQIGTNPDSGIGGAVEQFGCGLIHARTRATPRTTARSPPVAERPGTRVRRLRVAHRLAGWFDVRAFRSGCPPVGSGPLDKPHDRRRPPMPAHPLGSDGPTPAIPTGDPARGITMMPVRPAGISRTLHFADRTWRDPSHWCALMRLSPSSATKISDWRGTECRSIGARRCCSLRTCSDATSSSAIGYGSVPGARTSRGCSRAPVSAASLGPTARTVGRPQRTTRPRAGRGAHATPTGLRSTTRSPRYARACERVTSQMRRLDEQVAPALLGVVRATVTRASHVRAHPAAPGG